MSNVPPAPGRDRRHRQHSTKTMKLVRDMHAGGWTPRQIVRYLAGHGIEVHETTVRRWTIPAEADEQRRANRRRMREVRRREKEARSVLSRINQLRSGGLSREAVAKVLRIDGVADLTADQVMYWEDQQREPSPYARRGTGKRAQLQAAQREGHAAGKGFQSW